MHSITTAIGTAQLSAYFSLERARSAPARPPLAAEVLAVMREAGWKLTPSNMGFRFKKACAGYPAKLFEVAVSVRERDTRVFVIGRLSLHGMRCVSTPCLTAHACDVSQLVQSVAEATQQLSIFDSPI